MALIPEKKKSNFFTRRAFLVRASLGLAGLAAVASGASKMLFHRFGNKPTPPSFVAKDSIFRPREDTRPG